MEPHDYTLSKLRTRQKRKIVCVLQQLMVETGSGRYRIVTWLCLTITIIIITTIPLKKKKSSILFFQVLQRTKYKYSEGSSFTVEFVMFTSHALLTWQAAQLVTALTLQEERAWGWSDIFMSVSHMFCTSLCLIHGGARRQGSYDSGGPCQKWSCEHVRLCGRQKHFPTCQKIQLRFV